LLTHGDCRACLLDSYTHTSCPSCNRDITSTTSTSPPQIQVLCTLTNEGGTQPDLDILPLLTEESYLKAYPEDRRARAFLEFCREGDVAAVVELLQSDDVSDDDDEDDEDAMEDTTASGEKGERRQIDLLRYQDPIGDMQSALHAAVAGGSREVAWLLLLLASQLPLPEFPAIVFQEADKLGVMRGEDDMAGKADIRTLRDADGRSAEDVAKDVGVIWNGWVGNGRLAI
jgi:hypothetical protein